MHQVVFDQTTFVRITDAHRILADVTDRVAADQEVRTMFISPIDSTRIIARRGGAGNDALNG